MLSLVALAAALALGAAVAAAPTHSVVGTGFVDLTDELRLDIQFRGRLVAFQEGAGRLPGTVVSQVWLDEFGLGDLTAQTKVACLTVDGDQAWIGSVVTHSTSPSVFAVGDMLITMVFDLGGEGMDIMHTESAKNLPTEFFDSDNDGDVDRQDRPDPTCFTAWLTAGTSRSADRTLARGREVPCRRGLRAPRPPMTQPESSRRSPPPGRGGMARADGALNMEKSFGYDGALSARTRNEGCPMVDTSPPGRFAPLPPDPPSLDLDTTRVLLERARAGDSAALERLCARYLPALRRWATGRLPRWARDHLDTDDLVQEALLETLKRLDTFQPRHEGAFRAYLRQTLQNRIYDEIQRARRRPPGVEIPLEGIDRAPWPREQAIGREALERYERALGRLDDEAREAVVLRVEMGCSYIEVAEALEKPSSDAARMTVRRALMRLVEAMGHER